MVNGKNVTSKVKNEKKGIRCFNALLKIESYMLNQNLREFKQRAAKNHYNESFIFDMVREDRMTFSNQMIGAINALQMAELITAQESENMLKKVQEQAEIIKNRYFPPAERNEQMKGYVMENVHSSEKPIVTAVVLDINLYDGFDGYDLRDFPGKCSDPLQNALDKLNSGLITEEEFCGMDLSDSYVENGLSHDLNCGLGMEFHDVDDGKSACLRQEIKAVGKVDGVFKITTYEYDAQRDDIREGAEEDIHYCTIDGKALGRAMQVPSFNTAVRNAEADYKNKAVSDTCSISVKDNISDQNPVKTLQLGGSKKCKRKM